MAKEGITDEQFIKCWQTYQGAADVAKALGIMERTVHARRRVLEERYNIDLLSRKEAARIDQDNMECRIKLKDGTIMVGSDPHYNPDLPPSTAHKAFVKMAKKLKPDWIVMNGDLGDFPAIGRFHRIGWEKRPTVAREINCIGERLAEIREASPGSRVHRTIGNHDLRFDGVLSNKVPEYEGIKGMTLDYHLKSWPATWTMQVNDPCELMIMHRWKSSLHAPLTNAKEAGCSFLTGHLHRQHDYDHTYVNNRQIYGIDAGTMAELHDGHNPSFLYTEGRPTNWRAGWYLLTFRNGLLMPPERCKVLELGRFWWRGELYEV